MFCLSGVTVVSRGETGQDLKGAADLRRKKKSKTDEETEALKLCR